MADTLPIAEERGDMRRLIVWPFANYLAPSERLKRDMLRQSSVERWAAQQIEQAASVAVSNDSEPEDWQERHSPTEPVMVKISAQRQMQAATRRKQDARMWAAMKPEHERAAEAIAAAVLIRTGQVGYKTQDLERLLGRSAEDPEGSRAVWQTTLVQRYDDWIHTARLDGWTYEPSDVAQILVHGQSCAQQDTERRQRHGKALENLLEGLEAYAWARGWLKPRY